MSYESVSDGKITSLARDTFWLGLAQATQYAVPLVLVPYLGWRLGVAAWGEVMAVLAAGNLLALLPAYGFMWTGPRTLAQAPDAPARRAIVSGTAGVRGVLTLLAVGLGAIGVVTLGDGQPIAWAGLVYVAAQGVTWGWAFEGVGRFRTAALLYLLARAPVPLLVLLTVHSPADAARVPLAYAAASLAETIAGFVLVRRAELLTWPEAAAVRGALRDGAPLFAGQLAVLSYVGVNALWLRLLAPAAVVGVYAAAEAAARAATGAVQPLSRALLPRLATAVPGDSRWVRTGFVGGLALGVVGAVALYVAAPLLPRVLGSDFGPSVEVLRMLAPLPLLVALSQAAGVNVALARRRDGRVALLFGVGALVNLTGAVVLAPRFGAEGMARAVLAAEAVVTLLSFVLLCRR